MRLYFDTCVWIRIFEQVELNEVESIKIILNWNKQKNVSILSSLQVEKELKDLINEKRDPKFSSASKTMKKHCKEYLVYPAFILGDPVAGAFGLCRLGDGRKFQRTKLKSQDKEIAEFLVDNNVDAFISVDGIFTKTNLIQEILKKHKPMVLNPIEFVVQYSKHLTSKYNVNYGR